MSLDKAIKHGKEFRQGYRGSATFDRSCRPHGGGYRFPCPLCERDRRVRELRMKSRARDLERDALCR